MLGEGDCAVGKVCGVLGARQRMDEDRVDGSDLRNKQRPARISGACWISGLGTNRWKIFLVFRMEYIAKPRISRELLLNRATPLLYLFSIPPSTTIS